MIENVLLIDDDRDDTELFTEALNELNDKLHTSIFHNGNDALTFLRNEGVKNPDIIFIDVNMPGLSGWECLQTIKEDSRFTSIPVVMYSTSSYRGDADKAFSLGAICFFTKPGSFNDLKKILSVITSSNTNNLQARVDQICKPIE